MNLKIVNNLCLFMLSLIDILFLSDSFHGGGHGKWQLRNVSFSNKSLIVLTKGMCSFQGKLLSSRVFLGLLKAKFCACVWGGGDGAYLSRWLGYEWGSSLLKEEVLISEEGKLLPASLKYCASSMIMMPVPKTTFVESRCLTKYWDHISAMNCLFPHDSFGF